MSSRKIKKKLIFKIASALVIVIVCSIIINLLTATKTLGNVVEEVWDGTSASSFSAGNGTKENPYQIKNGKELAYFKQLTETKLTTQVQYYVLMNDIDLGNNEWAGIGIQGEDSTLHIFKDHFDGNSYTIKNAKLEQPTTINNKEYYGLFTIVENATIENLNISNMSVIPQVTDKEIVAGTLIAEIKEPEQKETSTTIQNIALQNIQLDTTKTIQNVNSKIGGAIGKTTATSTITNIYTNVEINSNYNTGIGKVFGTLTTMAKNVVNKTIIHNFMLTNIKEYGDSSPTAKLLNSYQVTMNEANLLITKQGSVIETTELLQNLNSFLGEKYMWIKEHDNLKITLTPAKDISVNKNYPTIFSFNSKQQKIALHDSGITATTVYINDLQSDYNHFLGKNYTNSTGTLPTPENKNIYNNTNLVKVYIAYSAQDINNASLVGHVSLSEQQSMYVYYKYYYVEDGYINIDLIDNPFTDRPTDKAFNGWVTDYVGATTAYNQDYYKRTVKIPITYTTGTTPDDIAITFYANWTTATKTQLTSNSASVWATAFADLNNSGMQQIGGQTPIYEDVSNYFIYGGEVDFYSSYPSNSYDDSGESVSGRCTSWGGCDYYLKSPSSEYDSNETYYRLLNRRLQEYMPQIIDYEQSSTLADGMIAAGYYKQINLPRYESTSGYYNEQGQYQESGTCNTSGGCTYYELIQYYDNTGKVNIVDNKVHNYYYLVTRDTNIIVLRTNLTYTWGSNQAKPFTLTSIYNRKDYTNYYFNVSNLSIQCYNDTVLENIYLYTTQRSVTDINSFTSSTRQTKYLYGNWNNVKIGRGLKHNQDYVNLVAFIGGSNKATGSKSNITKYSIIVESGYYSAGTTLVGGIGSTNVYVESQAIYGSDYDRIKKDNTTLTVTDCLAGSWGGNIYASTTTSKSITAIFRSGQYGSRKGSHTSGIYVGQRQGGSAYSLREAKIEGGWFYVINGGPSVGNNFRTTNSVMIYVTGGEITMLFGGAGLTTTYGNRIIQMTGGKVDYSVFGGSNAYTSTSGDGTVYGSSYIYIGGTSQIGDQDLVDNENTLFNAHAGGVFGHGDGGTNSTAVGSNDNSTVIIDGDAHILKNVYGGSNNGLAGSTAQQKTSITLKVLNGIIEGNVYGGGNNNGVGSSSVPATINIDILGGIIRGSVFGGNRAKGIVTGSANVNISKGTIETDVYGGGEGGYVSTSNSGTYISKNVLLKVGTTDSSPTIKGNIYGGSAYGTVGSSSYTTTQNNNKVDIEVANGIINGSVFGGAKGSNSYSPHINGNIVVIINGGNIGQVFGGNDEAGNTYGTNHVYLNGGVIGNAYGGGDNTGQDITNIYLQGASVTDLFGGSNASGTVKTSHVTITSGIARNIYGSNNIGGKTNDANVTITGSTISEDVYGGGHLAATTTSKVDLGRVTLQDVYGGGEKASVDTTEINTDQTTLKQLFGGSNISGEVKTSNITIKSSIIANAYGGNNQGGTTVTTNMTLLSGQLINMYGGGDNASSTNSNIIIQDGKIQNIYGGGNAAGLNIANITIEQGQITNVFGGSNNSGNLATANIQVGKQLPVTNKTEKILTPREQTINSIIIDNLYGGNNKGGVTSKPKIKVTDGKIGNIYGGGNQAAVDTTNVLITGALVDNIYGGGNQAGINNNTTVNLSNSQVTSNVYGGGNEGPVSKNTTTKITDTTILGSAYAGGNGSTAIVTGDTTITVDGSTVIGSPTSIAPKSGCLFGGGKAAATGTQENNNSLATVNLVGATIYGNVYGGANTSVVYGKTATHIGTNTINTKNLIESDILISGTIFGGGEANANGDEIYDYSFISVTGAIDIKIDGKNYLSNLHRFELSGSVFGSGNASSSSGTSDIYIANLGTRNSPSKNISIQRANSVILDNTVMELSGTTDRTNEYSDIKYSLNRINQLNIKNNTMLLLQQNANLLENLKSTVDINKKEEISSVIIDDTTKTVTKNVDNRLYMLANKNLNVTTNEAATAYGQVTGMTFFGMYNTYGNGSYSYGMYDSSVNYGDAGDAGDIIIGGSYVLGLHSLNHDITIDGFYTNSMDDAYTEITTAYVNPTPPDSNYYMWAIGMQAVNYSFAITASKYSTLGTYELSMREFSKGDTIFDVIGFNSEGLTSGVELIDSTNVPKLADTEKEANSILGLSMKTETSEWTSHGVTKMLSENSGNYTGTKEYKTDSQVIAPSFMFYLYHAKNITLNEELGTVVISLQAKTPKNKIEYEVQLITITIDLVAKNYNDGDSYDASITYNKKYELPAATTVNITNESQFTAYFDLYAPSESLEDFYGRGNTNYHALTSDYALPVGTEITLLDYGSSDGLPQYYHLAINQQRYEQAVQELAQSKEITYRLSEFIKMGSTSPNNTYDDKKANISYYDAERKRTIEEFIFIFDFKDTNTTGDHLDNHLLFELRNKEDRAVISVLGIRQPLMYYNLYESSNMVLNQTIVPTSEYIYPDILNDIAYTTSITYDQTTNREAIINTNYESTNMGLNITLYDQTGNQVSSSMLTGTSIYIDNKQYFVDSDGTFRIKLAGKVSNLNKTIQIAPDSNTSPGIYKVKFTLFASSDGLHNSYLLQYAEKEINLTFVNSDNAIQVKTEDKMKLVSGETSQNELKTKTNKYQITLNQKLNNPNVRISLHKRVTESKNSTNYQEIELGKIFSNGFVTPESVGLLRISEQERIVSNNPPQKIIFDLNLKDNISSGTYKLIFKLYDKNQLIEQDQEYLIIHKKVT